MKNYATWKMDLGAVTLRMDWAAIGNHAATPLVCLPLLVSLLLVKLQVEIDICFQQTAFLVNFS